MATPGRKTPSIMGSQRSVYSTGSTLRTLTKSSQGKRTKSMQTLPWYRKPLVRTAFYTDLQRGSWHFGFYSFFVSIWTTLTSAFDIYCLHEAMPGSEHTGYYIIAFDFVYVGNWDVRNLLMMSAVFSLIGGFILFIASIAILDALRKEDERAFPFWLWTMGIFAPWKIIAWGFAGIVNDMIFVYNVLMLLVWFGLNILNCFAWVVIYSVYLEFGDLSKIQDLARLKMDTMSNVQSRATSAYGSRPTSPYIVNRQPPPLPVNSGPRGHTGYTPIQTPQSSLPPTITVTQPRNQQYQYHQDPLYDVRGNANSQVSDIF